MVDLLRGVALVGVGAANLLVFNTSNGHFESYAQRFPDALNQFALQFFMVFLKGKFYSLFALLFGLSAALALQARGVGPFLKRAAVLGVLGVLHLLLVWRGDVLLQYALMGLLLLLIRRWPTTLQVGVAVSLFLLGFAETWLAPPAPEPIPLPDSSYWQAVWERSSHTFLTSWALEDWLYQARIFAWLLLGYLLGEGKRYEQFLRPKAVVRVLLAAGMSLLLAGVLIQVLGLRGEQGRGWETELLKLALTAVFYAGNVLLLLLLPVAFYVSGVARRVVALLSSFGKMTLTHYLLQNLLFSWLFFGYGLGWYRQVAPVTLWVGYLVLVLVQVLASYWWLGRFGQGPFEKLVRYFTRR